jgi:hypothetical protein
LQDKKDEKMIEILKKKAGPLVETPVKPAPVEPAAAKEARDDVRKRTYSVGQLTVFGV